MPKFYIPNRRGPALATTIIFYLLSRHYKTAGIDVQLNRYFLPVEIIAVFPEYLKGTADFGTNWRIRYLQNA